MINKFILFVLTVLLFSGSVFYSENEASAQDIPELHMIVAQGDIAISGTANSDIDGLLLYAKIGNNILGSVEISKNTTSSRYVSLEIGPNDSLEGEIVEFWIGNQKALETIPFGPTTPSGTYWQSTSSSQSLSPTR